MKKKRLNRSRAYYRKQRIRVINRKLEIRRFQWGKKVVDEVYDCRSIGKLSKGKVHCSCWMCSTKSKDCLSAKDLRELDRLNYELKNHFFGYDYP